MDIQVPQQKFLEKVQKLQSVVEKSISRPILMNILIEATAATEPAAEGISRGKAVFVGTDLEIGIQDSLVVEVAEAGAITVPGRKLYEALQELPPAPVRFTTLENKWIEVKCGNAQFKMMGLPADRYPGIPDVSTVALSPVNRELLGKLVRFTNYATSMDENRPVLNGILFKVTPEIIRVVATDGHRMALAEVGNEGSFTQPVEVIISNKTVHELLRLVTKSEGDLRFGINESMVVFASEEEFVVAKLISGEYPNYDMVIPKELLHRAIIDRVKLYGLVHRVRLFADSKTHTIKLHFHDNLVEVTGSSAETGIAKDHMAIEYEGAEQIIGFNADYLLQMLKVLESEAIELFIIQSDEPVMIKPFYGDKPSSISITNLIMPIVT